MSAQPYREHPENDLFSDADYANRRPPAAHDFDELADAPDPLVLAQANRQSTTQALWYMATSLALSAVVAFFLAAVFSARGGPLCDAGEATWLCTPTQRTAWAVATLVVPFCALIGNAVLMVRKVNRYLRWRPWMGIFWVVAFNFMLWTINNIQLALTAP